MLSDVLLQIEDKINQGIFPLFMLLYLVRTKLSKLSTDVFLNLVAFRTSIQLTRNRKVPQAKSNLQKTDFESEICTSL